MNINFTLFAQAAVFLAFIGFTIKFVGPPMLKAIETRQKTIADGLAAADYGRGRPRSSEPVPAITNPRHLSPPVAPSAASPQTSASCRAAPPLRDG